MSWKSSFAAQSPCNIAKEGTLFVALKVYFDGSVEDSKCVTLACLAADDSTWVDLEQAWESARIRHGNPAYLHMTDLVTRNGIYQGWTELQRDNLIDGMLQCWEPFREHPKLRSFICTVDLASHGNWKVARRLPTPPRLCVRVTFPQILDWYLNSETRVLDLMELVFDRNEPFMRHLDADWRSKSIRRRYPMWDCVRSIGSAVAEHTPALQMTDFIAWGRNRIASGSTWETDPLYSRAFKAYTTIAGDLRTVGEKALSSSIFPASGGRTGLNSRSRAFSHVRT